MEEWEDVDYEDANSEEMEEHKEEDAEKKSISAISVEKSDTSHSDPVFSIITSDKKDGKETNSFTMIGKSQEHHNSSQRDHHDELHFT